MADYSFSDRTRFRGPKIGRSSPSETFSGPPKRKAGVPVFAKLFNVKRDRLFEEPGHRKLREVTERPLQFVQHFNAKIDRRPLLWTRPFDVT